MSDLAAYRADCIAKHPTTLMMGLETMPALNPSLFDHQVAGVEFALRAGRAGLFYDTGLGKTAMELEWGRCIVERLNRPVLMLSPLAVQKQHVKEAERLGIETVVSRLGTPPPSPCVVLTNYERLGNFDPADFGGVILDESSILKSFSGVTTRKLIDAFASTRFRLAGTATPAPNDHTELGQHSEFLGALSLSQMLTRWFLHDSADTGTWRMKRHAERIFWDWVASWARCVSKPSDLGFSDDGYILPELQINRHVVFADRSLDRGEEKDGQGRLFRLPDQSATGFHKEKRLTVAARAEVVAQLVASAGSDPVVIWVDTDYEADAIRALLPGIHEVRGSMSIDRKEETLDAFSTGKIQTLLTKPSIAGFGLNWQHCNTTIFAGVSFSYESFYQAIRRFWRFGQRRPVTAHVVCADTEIEISDVVQRKSGDHEHMKRQMSAAMVRASSQVKEMSTYLPTIEARLPAWI